MALRPSLTQVPEVQVHEPYLATSHAEALQLECSHAYQELAAEGVPLNLVVAYDDVGEWHRQEPKSQSWLTCMSAASSARSFFRHQRIAMLAPIRIEGNQAKEHCTTHAGSIPLPLGLTAGHTCVAWMAELPVSLPP